MFSSFVAVRAVSGFLVLGVAANTGTNANCQLEVGNDHLNFSSNYRRKEEVARYCF